MYEFCETFIKCERKEGFFRRQINGEPFWHLIRYWVFNDLVLPHYMNLGVLHPDDLAEKPLAANIWGRFVNKLSRLRQCLADWTIHNPGLSFVKRPILFVMTPRMCTLSDGRQATLMLDFIADRLQAKYALFEQARPCGYTRQPVSRKVFHLLCSSWRRRRILADDGAFASGASERRKTAEELAAALECAFGFPFEAGRIWWMIDSVLRKRALYRPLMQHWLKRFGTKVVVTSVAEAPENALFIESAHDLGLPVVELQHGTVYPQHMVYNLGEQDSHGSPDYFLTWGEYWKSQLRNYPAVKAVNAGYPFLEHFTTRCPRIERKSGDPLRVLFLSQGGIGRELSKLAMRIHRRLSPSVCSIVYKLHPNETLTWRSLYPDLVSSGIRVVPNDEKNIYQCLMEADVTVGTNSTAMIEGFAWGVRGIVLGNLPGGRTMEAFRDAGAADIVDSEDDLCARLEALQRFNPGCNTERFSGCMFWAPNAAENVSSFINELAANTQRHCQSSIKMV